MHVEGELHIALRHVGHCDSADCWCEPERVYFAAVQGLPGITKVIVHSDECNEPHLLVINRRERDRFVICNKQAGTDDPWITRALTPPWSGFPSDPNERKS